MFCTTFIENWIIVKIFLFIQRYTCLSETAQILKRYFALDLHDLYNCYYIVYVKFISFFGRYYIHNNEVMQKKERK